MVLCGHIHSVSIRSIGDVTYYNCGDWVETCSALVEDYSGRIKVITYLPHAQPSKRVGRSRELIASCL
jgi:UDP-2,3-diacylglucosamine pyrophosphatase LpxH